MSPLRISAISFLNTAPLMWDFEHADAARDFAIQYTIPSTCAAALAADQADIGIIPAITYAQIPELVILPNILDFSAVRDRVGQVGVGQLLGIIGNQAGTLSRWLSA